MAETLTTLEDAFLSELQDVLHAEKQITKALPKMIKKAKNDQLRTGLQEHLQQTEEQIRRLEQVFEILGEKPKAKKCEAMAGIIKEGDEVMKEKAEPEVRDALLIAAAQKVEHYEIATYGTLCAWSDLLGHRDATRLLKQTLNEEKEADKKLTQAASQINIDAEEPVGAET